MGDSRTGKKDAGEEEREKTEEEEGGERIR